MQCVGVSHSLQVFARHHILLTNLICFVAFTIQFGNILHAYINPVNTNIRLGERNISEFPLILKICFSPGINISAVEEAGYKSIYRYFYGQSKYNKSILGWAGYRNTSGVRGSVKDLMDKVQLHTVEKVIDKVKVKSWVNEWTDIKLSLLKVRRMNYPYNCFTLDLLNDAEVEQNGVKRIALNFMVVENTSVNVFLQGKTLACDREIKAHKFYSSVASVKLTNLGKKKLPFSVFLYFLF